MAEVLLFHHALGQTVGFHAFADELRRAGHTVHTPDLFEGRTFGSIDEGIAYAGGVGFGEVIERGGGGAGGGPGSAFLLPLPSPLRVRDVVAGGRAGADPRHGRRPVLRRRGRPRRCP